MNDSIQVHSSDGIEQSVTINSPAFKLIGNHPDKNKIIAVSIDQVPQDLSTPLTKSCQLEWITTTNPDGLHILRHSSTHMMAQAVKRLYPESHYTIGPVIQQGFYYDFFFPQHLSESEIDNIEQEMKQIVYESLTIKRKMVSVDWAIEFFTNTKNIYKIELLNEMKEKGIQNVSIYEQGEFTDLCRGPHVPNTKHLKAFRLLNIAGTYWRAIPSNTMLQRIYGTAFADKQTLKNYLLKREEAKKRDHRKLGKQLNLFSFQQEAPGFPFWHAKGTILFQNLVHWIQSENQQQHYQEVRTPILLNESLWHKSGHYDNFKENMYFSHVEKANFAIKPMNCPGHCLIYKENLHSYRDLPLKISEFGLVHRQELSGVLHGLFRVRSFTQDDAHIYCTQEQLKNEIIELIRYTQMVYNTFGFESIKLFLATKPQSFIGEESLWEKSTQVLKDSMDELELTYQIKEGEGAFYGPKIEFNIEDSLERMWQCGTIQIDFSMPERFNLSYRDSNDNECRPVMIHRAILGSIERFIAILIEHTNGHFPLWLAPVQVCIIPVSENNNDYALQIEKKLTSHSIHTQLSTKGEKLGYQIRRAKLDKIPLLVIVGDKEMESNQITLRNHDKDIQQKINTYELIELIIQSHPLNKNRSV